MKAHNYPRFSPSSMILTGSQHVRQQSVAAEERERERGERGGKRAREGREEQSERAQWPTIYACFSLAFLSFVKSTLN